MPPPARTLRSPRAAGKARREPPGRHAKAEQTKWRNPSHRRSPHPPTGTQPPTCPPGTSTGAGFQIVDAVSGWARLVEFPDIGHAPLLEIPDQAVFTVKSFFTEILNKEAPQTVSAVSGR